MGTCHSPKAGDRHRAGDVARAGPGFVIAALDHMQRLIRQEVTTEPGHRASQELR